MPEKLLTASEVAKQLQLPESEVVRMARAGELKGLWIGGELLRFHPDDLIRRLSSAPSKTPQPAQLPAAPPTQKPAAASWLEWLRDLFYTYDFYVMAVLLIVAMVGLIIAFQ